MKIEFRRWMLILAAALMASCGAHKSQKTSDSLERRQAPAAEAESLEEDLAVSADEGAKTTRLAENKTPTPGVVELVEGNQAFSFDMHKAVDTQNLVYSPHSISTLFGPLYAGAAGETRQEIGRVMHYSDVGERELHPNFARLARELTSRERENDEMTRGFRLRISNAIWVADGLNFSTDFMKVVEPNYLMSPRNLDFRSAPEDARKAINDYVESSTAGKIQDFLKPGVIDTRTRVVLTNAVYFNAAWMLPFSKASTKDGDFNAPDGVKKHPFMRQVERHRFLEARGFKMLELPYAGGEVSAFVLLPDEGEFDTVDRSMTAEKFRWAMGQMGLEKVDVRLPKFKLRSKLELGDTLQAMGIKGAFDARSADFGPMFSNGEQVMISKVLHEGFISVDEAGTEAAAASGGVMRPTGGMLGRPQDFHVDRPFTFFVVDRPTGAILFTARVSNPQI